MIDRRIKRIAGWTLSVALLILLWPNALADSSVQRPRGSGTAETAVRESADLAEETAAVVSESADLAEAPAAARLTAAASPVSAVPVVRVDTAVAGAVVSRTGAARTDAVPASKAAGAAAEGQTADGKDAGKRRVPAAIPSFDAKDLFVRLAGGDRTGGVLAEEGGYAEPERPTVYLTFDDGPSDLTPQVLDILAEYGVPATFFVLGNQAEKREETVRRILREGHAIGNHTYNHDYQELYGSFEDFYRQVERTNAILERITGERVALLRAPGGTATNFDAFYFFYLTLAGYRVHDWNVDSGDSKRRGVPAAEIAANVKKAALTREMNVLLHDGAGHEETVKALPEIIEYFREQGYRFAALTDEVKPVVFRVGKVKWKRNTDEREHARLLALVEPGLAAPGLTEPAGGSLSEGVLIASAAEPTAASAEETVRETEAVREKAQVPPPGQVPLREWAKRSGATVVWDPVKETATLTLGGSALEWSVREGAGWFIAPDGQRKPLAFGLTLHHDRLHAPAAALDRLFANASAPRVAVR